MMLEGDPIVWRDEPRAVFVFVPFQVDRAEPFNHHDSRLLSNPTPMVVSTFRKRRRTSGRSEENQRRPSEQQETAQARHILVLGQAVSYPPTEQRNRPLSSTRARCQRRSVSGRNLEPEAR